MFFLIPLISLRTLEVVVPTNSKICREPNILGVVTASLEKIGTILDKNRKMLPGTDVSQGLRAWLSSEWSGEKIVFIRGSEVVSPLSGCSGGALDIPCKP
jgi:hypothetical protein